MTYTFVYSILPGKTYIIVKGYRGGVNIWVTDIVAMAVTDMVEDTTAARSR